MLCPPSSWLTQLPARKRPVDPGCQESNVTLSEQPRRPVSFLVLSAALPGDSLNNRLARLAAQVIEQQGGSVDHA